MRDLYALDVDETLKLSGGSVFTETLEQLEASGDKVVIVSPSSSAQGIWDRFDRVTAEANLREDALLQVKELYPGYDRYFYISDNPDDDLRASATGFEYIHPGQLEAKTPNEQATMLQRGKLKPKPSLSRFYTDTKGRIRAF